MNKIESLKEIHNFIHNLDDWIEKETDRSVEEYLRALWAVVNKYRFESVTGDLLAQVIIEAFEVEPAEFDEQWLEYDYVYSGWGLDDSGYLPQRYDDVTGKYYVAKRGLTGFELLRDVLLQQIADMHRMNVAPPPMLTRGYRSFAGIEWGFYPFPNVKYYLQSGISRMYELSKKDALLSSDWVELAIILHFARLADE